MNWSKFPEITTDRLLLTELHLTDVPLIVKYADNKNISDNTLNLPYPYAEKDAHYWLNMASEGFINKTKLIFAIRSKESYGFMGSVGLTLEQHSFRAEIGYWLAEPFWKKGYMTEAVQATIRFGMEQLHLNKISGHYFEKNVASGQVMSKCGMQKEGVLKEHVFKDPLFHNLIVYGITQREFQSISQTNSNSAKRTQTSP